jgi:integrase
MASIESNLLKGGGKSYTVRYRDPEHNNKERTFKRKAAAEDFKRRVEIELTDGVYFDRNLSKVSFAEVSEEWFSSLIDIKPSTRSGYAYSLKSHVLPTWGDKQLRQIELAAIQKWVAELSADRQPSTVRSIYLVLKMVLDYAVKTNLLRLNPCTGTRLPKKTKSDKRRYLTVNQVLALAGACGEYSDAIQVLALTGLRWGELASLTVADIDFGTRRIDVNKTITEISGALELGSPKSGIRRSVPFPAFLENSLKVRCMDKQPTASVFPAKEGGVLRNNNFMKRVYRPAVLLVQKRHESFPSVTIHDLRHTAASLAVSAGANVKSLQRMLGHEKASLTLDTYADLFEDDLDAVGVALDNLVNSSVVGI